MTVELQKCCLLSNSPRAETVSSHARVHALGGRCLAQGAAAPRKGGREEGASYGARQELPGALPSPGEKSMEHIPLLPGANGHYPGSGSGRLPAACPPAAGREAAPPLRWLLCAQDGGGGSRSPAGLSLPASLPPAPSLLLPLAGRQPLAYTHTLKLDGEKEVRVARVIAE